MIHIDDSDMPIQVAEKIISSTKEVTMTPLMKSLREAVTGEDSGDITFEDMFDLDDIKEIADYLMVYYLAHIKGDEDVF